MHPASAAGTQLAAESPTSLLEEQTQQGNEGTQPTRELATELQHQSCRTSLPDKQVSQHAARNTAKQTRSEPTGSPNSAKANTGNTLRMSNQNNTAPANGNTHLKAANSTERGPVVAKTAVEAADGGRAKLHAKVGINHARAVPCYCKKPCVAKSQSRLKLVYVARAATSYAVKST